MHKNFWWTYATAQFLWKGMLCPVAWLSPNRRTSCALRCWVTSNLRNKRHLQDPLGIAMPQKPKALPKANCLDWLLTQELSICEDMPFKVLPKERKVWKAVTPHATKTSAILHSGKNGCFSGELGQRSKSKTDLLSCDTPRGQVLFPFSWRVEPCCRGQKAWRSHRMDEKRDFKSLGFSQLQRVLPKWSRDRPSYYRNRQQEGGEKAGKHGNSLKWRLPFRVICLVQSNTPPGVLKQAPKEGRIPIPTMVLWWATISLGLTPFPVVEAKRPEAPKQGLIVPLPALFEDEPM